MKKRIISALALVSALSAGAANATVLFENGVDGSFWSGNNPFTYQMVTDDFFLSQNANVNTLTYNAFTTADTLPVTNVQVSIFTNNAGLQGSLLFQGDFGVAATKMIGTLYGYNLTDYTVNLGSLALNAGTYFLGLHVSPGQNDEHWSIPNQTYGQAGSDGFDHYFRLESNVAAVPEPETYAMMMAGIGLLGFIGRRRKSKSAA